MKEGIILSESTEAQKQAFRKYNAKCKEVKIRYTEKEMSEYNRLQKFLSENDTSLASYLKNLIKTDLDKKGYWLQSVPDCSETWKRAWNRRLTNGQFRKLGMITIIDFWAGMLNSVNSLSIKLFYCNTIWVSNSLELE